MPSVSVTGGDVLGDRRTVIDSQMQGGCAITSVGIGGGVGRSISAGSIYGAVPDV